MSLVLKEEQKMLKTSAKEFLDNKFPLSNFRKYRDNDFKSLDFDLWTEMAEMGWTPKSAFDQLESTIQWTLENDRWLSI